MFPGGSEVEQADGVGGRIVEEVGPVRIRLHVPVAAYKYKQKIYFKVILQPGLPSCYNPYVP